jgi:polyhydroxyalkanoate synthesis regulator phasin
VQEPPPVAPYVDDDRPATLADIRSLRRWLAVAAIWAVAATALAVIALLEANKDDTAGQTKAAGELGRVQRQLNSRIDDLQSQVDDLPTSDDLSKLDRRLKAVEDGADKSRAAAEKLSGRVDDLGGRVDDLETRVDDLESSNSNSGTATSP